MAIFPIGTAALQSFEQFRERCSKSGGDLAECAQSRLAGSAFQVGDVDLVDAGLLGKEKTVANFDGEPPAIIKPLLEKYSTLIDRFYEIAERKVSIVDEYGDENWEALDAEIKRVISKIETAEGSHGFHLPQELLKFLSDSFCFRYAKRKCKVPRECDFSRMSGVEFEIYVKDVLSTLDLSEVRHTPASNDQGADLLARKDGKLIVIQAKRYSGSVGNSAVQEVLGALHFYTGDEGWVVTNSTFTTSAKALAQRSGIRLIDGYELAQLIEPPAVKNRVEIWQLTERPWRPQGDGYWIPTDYGRLTLARDLHDVWWVRGTIDGRSVEIQAQNLAAAFNAADRALLETGNKAPWTIPVRDARWRDTVPSEKQIQLCRNLRIAIPEGATRGQVSAALDAHFAAKRKA